MPVATRSVVSRGKMALPLSSGSHGAGNPNGSWPCRYRGKAQVLTVGTWTSGVAAVRISGTEIGLREVSGTGYTSHIPRYTILILAYTLDILLCRDSVYAEYAHLVYACQVDAQKKFAVNRYTQKYFMQVDSIKFFLSRQCTEFLCCQAESCAKPSGAMAGHRGNVSSRCYPTMCRLNTLPCLPMVSHRQEAHARA